MRSPCHEHADHKYNSAAFDRLCEEVDLRVLDMHSDGVSGYKEFSFSIHTVKLVSSGKEQYSDTQVYTSRCNSISNQRQ